MRLTGSGVKSCKSRTLGKLFGSLRMKSCRSSRNIRPSKFLKKLVEEILEAVEALYHEQAAPDAELSVIDLLMA